MHAILMYNISDPGKLDVLRRLSVRLDFACITVAPEYQNAGLEEILNHCAVPSHSDVPFRDEMIVLAGFPESDLALILDELTRNSLRIALKAVMTPTNLHWSGKYLHAHLLAEHFSLISGRGGMR